MSEGSGLNVAERRRLWRESDRVIRPLKPGNASGGKDPDFWCAFEDGKVTVIGDEPANTNYSRIRALQRKLYRKAKATVLRLATASKRRLSCALR